jgi:hypothetical protein
MTEYEIADLAVSTQELFWQEWQAAQGTFQLVLDLSERFMTVLFGYLIVAYFIGAKLTSVQAGIMSMLYLFWLWRLSIAIYTLSDTGKVILSEMEKTSPDLVVAIPSVWNLIFLYSILTLASLYFMWSVRHPKTE